MPIIAVFYGIIVRMFYKDHDPPHFHAEYQGQSGKFDFDGTLIAGDIRSRTALKLIAEWADAHNEELMANWEKARLGLPIERISPLD
ncbi:MAG: DUF4160 domain-containing protein [candidate division Zixibacteria bacterium]|nr:DUF4160 domain-containing protein [candidate division Zixibacteria bacterium]